MIWDRWYQIEASDCAIIDVVFNRINSLVVAPPGSGKSIIPCKVIDEFLSKFPEKNVLLISDEENILEQDHNKLVEYFDGIRIGLYSSGIGYKTIEKITVAGIHSIYKNPELFKNIGLIIIDEAHKVTKESKGMYRKFLSFFDAPILGLTATPWNGRQCLTDVDDPIFTKISYDISEYKKYNRLVDEGYLVPLIPLPTDFNLDEEGIKIIGGDFDESEQSKKFDREEVTKEICKRIVKYGRKKYKRWLVFAIDIKHAENISAEINRLGFPTEALYTGSKRTKIEVISDFKRGDLRCVVNVGMVTTGVDIPEIDLIAHARLTQSPTFHVQTNGRGTRPVYIGAHDLLTIEGRLSAIKESGKTHCLVLDFARNAKRLGPINGIVVNEKKRLGSGVKQIMAKDCAACGVDNHLRALHCISCGEEFKLSNKLRSIPSNADIIKKDEPNKEDLSKGKWFDVTSISYLKYKNSSNQLIFKAEHKAGMLKISSYVCLDHKSFVAKTAALSFVKNRWAGLPEDRPKSVDDLYENRFALKVPSRIKVKREGEFFKIIDTEFDEKKQIKPKEIFSESNPAPKNKFMERFAQKQVPNSKGFFADDIPF